VAAGEGPAAQVAPGDEVVDGHRVDHRAALLVLQLAHVPVPAARTDERAEQDVRRGLEPALAGHDPGAVRGLVAGAEEPFQHGFLGLLHLQEQRIVVVRAQEERGERAQPHAAHAHDLHRRVDEL
jgi:hypothetical protein